MGGESRELKLGERLTFFHGDSTYHGTPARLHTHGDRARRELTSLRAALRQAVRARALVGARSTRAGRSLRGIGRTTSRRARGA
jgi:hypothetical protein